MPWLAMQAWLLTQHYRQILNGGMLPQSDHHLIIMECHPHCNAGCNGLPYCHSPGLLSCNLIIIFKIFKIQSIFNYSSKWRCSLWASEDDSPDSELNAPVV